jgi:pyruvate,orthophosphate dikinase
MVAKAKKTKKRATGKKKSKPAKTKKVAKATKSKKTAKKTKPKKKAAPKARAKKTVKTKKKTQVKKKTAPKTKAKKAAKTTKKTETKKKTMTTKKATTPKTKMVFFFGDGKAEGYGKGKYVLGGKGNGLADMTHAKVPVPPGFTITTDVCRAYYENNMEVPPGLEEQMEAAMRKLEKATNMKFGDPENPLLVSVRSGAAFSMPGMMDTVLNLGLNPDSLKGLINKTGNERFAHDNYRRFIAMFGNVVLGIDKDVFEEVITKKKKQRKVRQDTSLSVDDLKAIIKKFKNIVKEKSGEDFPDDPQKQLQMARDAVFRSWNNPRAITYRRLHELPNDLGTAVNVQTMVFGNMGDTSATGVGFTRNPSTGDKEFYGEYLTNAQGEDVVAGIRTPKPIVELKNEMPQVYKQLVDITGKLEKLYRDVQDFEFTIQEGKLYMLQTRTGKRTTPAAVKIAVDMVKEKLINREEALMRIVPADLDQLLHPRIDPNAKYDVVAKGLTASPGAAYGEVIFTADQAVEAKEKGKKVILVRTETNPDDIHGMFAAEGILTSRGGMTSHAAVVARGMGKPCVAGCEDIRVYESQRQFSIGTLIVKEGDTITINGTSGEVMIGQVPTIEPELTGEFGQFMQWADEYRKIGVRTNADTPNDALTARKFGAEGIGLCRTEHMFFAEDRLPVVQQMILADTTAERQTALDKLMPFQKSDFTGIFKAMEGLPVTIRTLDPPLHEFLPNAEEIKAKIKKLTDDGADSEKIEKQEKILARIQELHEQNPMLGHRGCRLGITYPEITEMQVRAIMKAACELTKKGKKVFPEIMIPLVGNVNELENQKEIVVRVAEEMLRKTKTKVDYKVGTMIEIPRAALTADQIAEQADFFSFGTNDLTQMSMGLSRDDAGRFLKFYVDKGILEKDPFVTLDQVGVGQLVKIGTEKGRETKKDLKIGICGEHGGDPASVEFCYKAGLNYVSCSPFRVPIARLAAGQAVIKEKEAGKKSKQKSYTTA